MTRVPTIEESPEQILARLERYAASLSRAPHAPRAASVSASHTSAIARPSGATQPWEVERAWDVAPSRPARRDDRAVARDLVRVALEAGGYAVGLAASVTAIFLFQHLDQVAATAIVFALAAGGMIATMRRLPLALWWTLGFAIGGLIARFS